MQELMRQLLMTIGVLTGEPVENYGLPSFEPATHCDMATFVDAPCDGDGEYLGLYIPGEDRLMLNDRLLGDASADTNPSDGVSDFGRYVLFHEMVHFVQDKRLNDKRDTMSGCEGPAAEAEAYDLTIELAMAERGLSRHEALDYLMIDPMMLAFFHTCPPAHNRSDDT